MTRLFNRFRNRLSGNVVGRKGVGSRKHLTLESLEQRALLSINPVLPLASVSLEAPNPAPIIEASGQDAGAIYAVVINDRNRNGIQDAGEGPIDSFDWNSYGWLDTNEDGIDNDGTHQGAGFWDGTVTWTGLSDGTYRVMGAGDAQVPGAANIVTISGGVATWNGQTLSESVRVPASTHETFAGEIGGHVSGSSPTGRTVFLDTNGDGSWQSGEPTTTTDGDGNFKWTGLPDGQVYSRLYVVPAAGGTVSSPAAGYYSSITNYDGWRQNSFDFTLEAAPTPTGVISGKIYNDQNRNGVMDAGEPELNWFDTDARVWIDTNDNGVEDSGEVGANAGWFDGNFSLTSLATGTYILRGKRNSTTWSDGRVEVSVTNGQTTTQNVGIYESASTITGVVWNDANNDGALTGGEGMIEGATVFLDTDNDGVLDAGETSVQTGMFGGYTLSSVSPGTYHVRVVLPAGSVESYPGTDGYTLTVSGGTYDYNDFGIFTPQPSTISGYVWVDSDRDGVRDEDFFPGSGIWLENGQADVTVYLDADNDGVLDAGEVSTTTNGDGNYSFTGILTLGTYNVRQVVPVDYVQTSATTVYSVNVSAYNTTYGGKNFGNASALSGVAKLKGVVWNDTNGDGSLTGGESLREGATVFLDTDNDGVLDVGETSVQMGMFGYSFDNLLPGTYNVRVVVDAGYEQTYPTTGHTVTVTNETVDYLDFGVRQIPPGSISGLVFGDVNGNGAYDAGDYVFDGGIDHSSVTVYLDANDNGSLDEGETSVQSGGSGYTFNNVAAGTYTVRVVTGMAYTVPSSGYYTVTVATSQNVTGKDFGLGEMPRISGVVWNDANGDGSLTGGETMMENVTVFLDADNDGVLDEGETSVQTGWFGDYTLTNVPVGAYHVRVVLTGNLYETFPVGGYHGTATIGQNITYVDFGLRDGTGHISGVVWNDANGDGSLAGEETMMEGITVFLDTDNDGVLDAGETSTQTGFDGAYAFNVDPGTYNVRVELPAGKIETYPGTGYQVTVGLGQTVDYQDFGLMSNSATISGMVWDDYNGNGLYDSGWPDLETEMSGVTLYLDANNNGVLDAGEATAQSGGVMGIGGSYSFTVTPGTYTVRAVAPSGKAVSAPATGSFTVTVSAGQTSTSNNFGLEPYTAVTTISGRVFEDANGNGVYDVMSDTYMNNITLYLDTNNNGVLDGGEASVLSASDGMSSGYYTFTGLTDGQTYVVRMQAPTGKAVSLPAAGYYSITLGTDTNTGRDFAYTNATGSISGYVFKDLDNDGVMDAGEPGMSESQYIGTKVYIDANNNGVFDSGSELYAYPMYPNGDYTFTSLAAGTYTVRVVAPSGYTQGATNGYLTVVVPTSSSAVTGQNLSLVEDVTPVAPKVTAVYVRGSSWNAAFLNGLATAGLGDATLGYKVSIGTDQLKSLPWTNINTINVVFDSDVTIAADDASLVGVNTALYTTNFSYNSTTHVATWTKSSGSFTKDKLLLHISGSAGGVTAGGALLDGEWTTSSSTLSGNGTAGGDFNFRLNVVPGDANRGLTTTSADVIQVRNAQGTTPAGGGLYTYYKDLNGSASITSADVIQARNNQGNSLPAGEPVAPSGMSAFAAALDELFSSEEEEDWLDMI